MHVETTKDSRLYPNASTALRKSLGGNAEGMIKNKRFAKSLFFIMFISLVLSSVLVRAQKAEAQVVPIKVSSFEVTTLDGRSVGTQPLMAGATYQIAFTLQIAAGIKDKAILKTGLSRTGDRFWSFSGNYSGIDVNTWQPGQPEISFDTIEGKVQMKVQGSVPQDFVEVTGPNGEQYHISKPISLLRVSLPGGRVLEDKTQEVVDKSIEAYRTLLNEKQKLLAENSTADKRYVSLVAAIVAVSETEAQHGYVEGATDLLQAIPQSGWIEPQRSSSYQWIIVGALALISAALLLVYLRSRSELEFARRRADEEAKRLEILASRARGIGDAKLSDEINKVKDNLEGMSGR